MQWLLLRTLSRNVPYTQKFTARVKIRRTRRTHSPAYYSVLNKTVQITHRIVGGVSQWRTEVGFGVFKPPHLPEIPKISVESSIAQARRTGVSISFYISLCSHTVVIYYIKVSFNTNCLAVAYLVSEFKPTPDIPKV